MEQESLLYCCSCGNIFPLEQGISEAQKAWHDGYDFGDCICPFCWADKTMFEEYNK